MLFLLAQIDHQNSTALAQGAAFTYQGRLNDGPNPANGSFDLRFTVYDALAGGTQLGGPLTNTATAVNNGLFTVTLDFGNVFTGANRWLEISARTNGNGSFSTLSPRQKVEPVPYAIFAQNAGGLANGVAMGSGLSNAIAGGVAVSFIGGGRQNFVGADFDAIAGGYLNNSSGAWGFIGGGAGNTNSTTYGVIGGGGLNFVNGFYGMIGGGYANLAVGVYSMVPGGISNRAAGEGSFAAGHRAQALHDGAFVWTDSQTGSFSSTAPNQFLIRASGGVGIGTTNPVAPLHVQDLNASGEGLVLGVDPHAGGFTALSVGLSAVKGGYVWFQGIKASGANYGDLIFNPGSGNVGIGTTTVGALLQVGSATCNGASWQNASDRALKDHLQAVNPGLILDKVIALPIAEWDYRQDASARHVGPMAQDFHRVFGLNGADDKHIATVDESGVALAAIQGLNLKLMEELKRRDAENAELNARLARLEKLLAIKLQPPAEHTGGQSNPEF